MPASPAIEAIYSKLASMDQQLLALIGGLSVPVPGIYDIGVTLNGTIGNVDVVRFSVVRAFTLPEDLTGSIAESQSPATASTTFTIKKNGASIGTIVWDAGETEGVFTFAAEVDFAADDLLQVTGPGSADASLADVSITLKGTR